MLLQPTVFLAALIGYSVAGGDELLRGATVNRDLTNEPKGIFMNTDRFLFEIFFEENADPPKGPVCLENAIQGNMAEVAKSYLVDIKFYPPTVVWGEVMDIQYIEQIENEEQNTAKEAFYTAEEKARKGLAVAKEEIEKELLEAQIKAYRARQDYLEEPTKELQKEESKLRNRAGYFQKLLDKAREKFTNIKEKANGKYDDVVRTAKELRDEKKAASADLKNQKVKAAGVTRNEAFKAAEDKAKKNKAKGIDHQTVDSIKKEEEEKAQQEYDVVKEKAEKEHEAATERFENEFRDTEMKSSEIREVLLEGPRAKLRQQETKWLQKIKKNEEFLDEAYDVFKQAQKEANDQYNASMQKAKDLRDKKKRKAQDLENEKVEAAREKKDQVFKAAEEKAKQLVAAFFSEERQEAEKQANDGGRKLARKNRKKKRRNRRRWKATLVVTTKCNFCRPDDSNQRKRALTLKTHVNFKEWMEERIEEVLKDNCKEAKKSLSRVDFIYAD